MAKNLMGKRRDPSEPYLTFEYPGSSAWTKVLKANVGDLTKPYASWLVQQDLGIGFGPGTGDSYATEVRGGRLVQFDPAVIEQVAPLLDSLGIAY